MNKFLNFWPGVLWLLGNNRNLILFARLILGWQRLHRSILRNFKLFQLHVDLVLDHQIVLLVEQLDDFINLLCRQLDIFLANQLNDLEKVFLVFKYLADLLHYLENVVDPNCSISVVINFAKYLLNALHFLCIWDLLDLVYGCHEVRNRNNFLPAEQSNLSSHKGINQPYALLNCGVIETFLDVSLLGLLKVDEQGIHLVNHPVQSLR